VNVVATLTVLVVGLVLLLSSLWMAKKERQRAKEMAVALRLDQSSPKDGMDKTQPTWRQE
jgi:Mg2+/citrate symporter